MGIHSRAVQTGTFLPKRKIPMGHNIFPLFDSKAIKKSKKIFEKNIFSLSRSRSKFLEKSLSKMAVFSSKDKWHVTI